MSGKVLKGLIVIIVILSIFALPIHSKSVQGIHGIKHRENNGVREFTHNIYSLFDRSDLGDDYPYDLSTIENMSLSELNWTQNATWYMNFTGPNGENYSLKVIEGTFGGKNMLGEDNYTMIPKYYLENGTIKLKTIHLKHAAVLFIPEKPYNLTNCTGYGHGIFVNTLSVPEPNSTYFQILVRVFMYEFNVPMLLVGDFNQNWKSFNFSGQDEILFPSAIASLLTLSNGYNISKALKMFYIYSLVRTDLLAHTLFERLVDHYGGNLSKGILSEGASKQSYANWLVSMLDNRVKVSECDHMQIENLLNSTRRYYMDWGLPPIENSSSGGWANYSNQVESILIPVGESLISGLANMSSPYSIFYDVWDISHQVSLIKSDLVSITGGLGVGTYENGEYKPSHDGTYFPLGAETSFLEKLHSVRWRYGRDYVSLSSIDTIPLSRVRILNNFFAAAEFLLNHNLSVWPKVENVTISTEDINESYEYLNVTGVVNYTGKNLTVKLWYAPSSDRRWNDPEQTQEPYNWKNVTMVTNDNRTFYTSVIINKSWMYGYYVEAYTPGIDIPDYWQLYRYDASPVEFINEYPYVVNGSCDFYISNYTVSNTNPNVGDNVWINASINVSRVHTWFEGPYVNPPLENIQVEMLVDGVAVGEKNITITHQATVSFTWIPSSNGIHDIEIAVNMNKIVYEYNYTNNTSEFLITVGNVPEIGSYLPIFEGILILFVLRKLKNS